MTVVKSTLKIPPRHNGAVPIRIKGHDLRDQVAYFITRQHTKKGLDTNIFVIDGTYNIKGKLTLHSFVENYTNIHILYNRGQCIGHMEPPIDNMPQTSVNSVITQKMIHEQVQSDTFKPPLHNLSSEVKWSLDKLLESFKSQFMKDEASIGMTNLIKMQIDTGNSNPVSQKPYPITMKHYDWVKNEINKLIDTKVLSLIIEPWTKSPKSSSGPCPKSRTSLKTLSPTITYPSMTSQFLKQPSHCLLENMSTWKFPLD